VIQPDLSSADYVFAFAQQCHAEKHDRW